MEFASISGWESNWGSSRGQQVEAGPQRRVSPRQHLHQQLGLDGQYQDNGVWDGTQVWISLFTHTDCSKNLVRFTIVKILFNMCKNGLAFWNNQSKTGIWWQEEREYRHKSVREQWQQHHKILQKLTFLFHVWSVKYNFIYLISSVSEYRYTFWWWLA